MLSKTMSTRKIPHPKKRLHFFIFWVFCFGAMNPLCFAQPSTDIKHIFLATDESRQQLLYVDEFDPDNDWTQHIGPNRDIQLISPTRFIISTASGYSEYEVQTGERIKTVDVGSGPWNWLVSLFKSRDRGIASAVRDERGHTFIANSTTIWELDNTDKLVSTLELNMGPFFRLLRLSQEGNFLFTGDQTIVKEANRQGEILRSFDLSSIAPEASKPYFAMQLDSGHYLISTGYGASLLELDSRGQLLRTIGGIDSIPGVKLNFFSSTDVLDNGHMVVAHWAGHNPQDSHKSPQVLEYDTQGKVVWQWHDPIRAGSLHGIAVIK